MLHQFACPSLLFALSPRHVDRPTYVIAVTVIAVRRRLTGGIERLCQPLEGALQSWHRRSLRCLLRIQHCSAFQLCASTKTELPSCQIGSAHF